MTLGEIKELLDADVIVGEEKLAMEVKAAFAADLIQYEPAAIIHALFSLHSGFVKR